MPWQKAVLLIVGMVAVGVVLFIAVYHFVKPKGR